MRTSLRSERGGNPLGGADLSQVGGYGCYGFGEVEVEGIHELLLLGFGVDRFNGRLDFCANGGAGVDEGCYYSGVG